MSKEALHVLREGLTEYNFSAQYQQLPVARDGNMVKFDWLRYYQPGQLPDFHHYFQSWDTANSAEELAAYSVCTTWDVFERNKFYLLDVYRRKINFPELKRDVLLGLREAKCLVEGITSAANGADRVGAISDVERFAQASDMNVHGAFIDIDVAPPYRIEKLLTRIDAPRGGHEKFKKPKLGRSQMNFTS